MNKLKSKTKVVKIGILPSALFADQGVDFKVFEDGSVDIYTKQLGWIKTPFEIKK